MPRFVPSHTPLLDLPEEVLVEVDAAWERAQAPLAGDVELAFDVSVTGRVRGELRTAEGDELVSRLSASEALALACGDAALALAA